MRSIQNIEQCDIGDEHEYHIRQQTVDQPIWPGRNGYPYLFRPSEYMDPALPLFHDEAFRLKLGAGKFMHRGAWAWTEYNNRYAMIRSNCSLIGEGRWTDLVLSDPVTSTGGKQRPDVHMIGVGSDYVNADGAVVEGINLSVASSVPKDVLVTSGIRGWGDDIRIRNVRVSGLRGSVDPVGPLSIPYEAFGISFDLMGGHIVEDCYAEGRNYFSAFSASFLGTTFRDCRSESDSGYAGFTVYNNTKVIDCEAKWFAYGVYNDTEDMSDVYVDRSTFIVRRVGVGIVSVDSNHYKCFLHVRDSHFVSSVASRDPWVGLEIIDKAGNTKFENMEFVGCTFEGDQLTIFSTNAKPGNVQGVRFIDCQFPKNCKLRANGNEIEIIRPRNLNGSLRQEQIPQVV